MGERGRTGGDAGAREERSGAPATWGGWRGKLHSFYGGGVGAELCTQTECHVSITIIFILIIFVSQAAANELFCFCPV